MIKGLYHWAVIIGIGDGPGTTFETSPIAWQAATMFFAVLDPVAGVGLWLAAAWGGVVWLTTTISMAAIELLFPQIFGGRIIMVLAELAAIFAYVWLTLLAGRERPRNANPHAAIASLAPRGLSQPRGFGDPPGGFVDAWAKARRGGLVLRPRKS